MTGRDVFREIGVWGQQDLEKGLGLLHGKFQGVGGTGLKQSGVREGWGDGTTIEGPRHHPRVL